MFHSYLNRRNLFDETRLVTRLEKCIKENLAPRKRDVCLPEFPGLDGNTVDKSHLEKYIQEKLVSRYGQELDKRDAFVLAKIAALFWAAWGYCNLDLNKVVEYRCSEVDSFEKVGICDATESRKKTVKSLTIRNTSKKS